MLLHQSSNRRRGERGHPPLLHSYHEPCASNTEREGIADGLRWSGADDGVAHLISSGFAIRWTDTFLEEQCCHWLADRLRADGARLHRMGDISQGARHDRAADGKSCVRASLLQRLTFWPLVRQEVSPRRLALHVLLRRRILRNFVLSPHLLPERLRHKRCRIGREHACIHSPDDFRDRRSGTSSVEDRDSAPILDLWWRSRRNWMWPVLHNGC